MKEILHRSQAESLFDILVYRKKQNPNKIVYKVINNDRSVTDVSYQDLWERVQEARTVLAGQDKDVPYFLLYESPIEFIIGFLALESLGVTGMPMTVPEAYEELERWENIYQDAGRAGVLTEKAQVKEIRERFSQSEILREADVFCNQREGKEGCESITEYRICPEALLQYTSGSTGIPKGVIITHQGILHSMEQTEKRFQVNEDSVFVNWVPFHHMLGSITGMLQSIYSNSQAVLLKPQQFMEEPLFWMELVSKFHATHTGAPNFAYELITKELSRRIQKMGKEKAQKELQKVYSMESLKIFYCAGEPVSVTTLSQFIQNVRLAGWSGIGVFPAYGLTETTQFSSTYSCGQKVSWLCVSREDLEKNVIQVLERGVLGEDIVSEREDAFYMMGAGYTMSEDCICILNQTGAKCKPYEIGEVNFAGDSLASGYWKKETADEESFWIEKETERRFLHTGDIGFLTEDGELFLTGRSKDLIILRGMNYVPQDIERVVQAASPIFNHYATAAFGIEKNGEEVLVILQEMEESISKEQHSKLEQKIKQAVLKAFQIRPEQILLVPEQSIPRTGSGKLRRGEAKKCYLEGTWDVKAEEESRKQKKLVKSTMWTKQKIEYFIKAQISEKTGLPEKKIDIDMPFLELGMNSIMFLDMRSRISEQCSSEISVADLFHYHTVREMTDYLYGVLKEETIEEKETASDNQSRYSDTEPLAIIGMACHLPGGVENEDDFWTMLEEKQDGVIPVEESRWNEREDVKEGYLKRAGFLKEDIEQFDCRLFRIAPAEAERIDPQQRLFLKTCWEAIENAGYAPDTLKGSRTGVYAGISSTEYQMEAWKDRMFGEKKRDAQENSLDLLGNYPSFLTGRVSYYFGLQGPAVTVDTACSSSLVSIDHACSDLRNQTCDMALAGGVNLMISPDTTKLVAGLHILSEDGIIRSFDDSANGTVRGEGCSVVVLKRLSKAIEDHDMIHAVIVGNRTNQDGPSAGMTAPYGLAQENLLKDTWRHFHIDSNDIDYMEAHGTGTKLGDPIELDAINRCLSKDRKHPLYIGTAKSNIGHLEAASGVAGLMKTVLMLEHKKIPGLLHFKKPNSHFNWERSLITVPKETIAWKKEGERMAGVSSFGLSGTNAHFVLKEFNQQWENLPEQDEYAFKFSSNTEKGLRKQISAFADYVKFYEGSMAVLSYSQNISKADLEERLVILAKTKEELYIRLLLVLDGKRDAKVLVRESEKPVVFLCTGQGSQYEKMLLDFYAENERFAYWMNCCEELYQSLTGNSLLNVIRQEGKILDETRYTQPSLFAVEYSLGKMWMEYGIEPKYLIGHSIGEYAAACLAGVFSLEDAMKLVTARGEYMFQLNTEGKMAALFCSREEALTYLEEGAVSIAAGNSPNQTILSGKTERVEAVCKAARAKGIKTAFLHVSHAFHSSLMEPMLAEFRKVAEAVRYHEPEIEILSNVTGKVVCREIADSEYWCRHILSEVRFEEGIRSISNPSDYVFLEIGPKPVLTALLRQICGKDVDCLISAYPKQDTEKQVLESVLSLYLHGCHISWRKLYGKHNYKRVRVPNYRFSEQKLGISQIQVLSGKVVQTKQLEKCNQKLSEEKEQRLILAEESPVIPEDWMAFLKQELSRELKLDTEEIKEDDNLLLFGINSIAVMRLTSKWNKVYALFLSTAEFMKHCTLKDWYNLLEHAAAHTEEKEEIKFESVPEEKGEPFELNPIQYAYWAGRNCEMEWGGAGCYACYVLKQKGLDVKHFQDAVIKLIERHDMLRCLIGKDGKQQIKEHVEIPLKIYPYKEDINMEELEEKVYSEIRLQVIPLDQPMYDIRLVESEKHNWTVYFGIDFMIADALSLRIIWNDLSALYQGKTLEALGVTYRDYLKYEKQKPQTKPYQAAKEYWMQKVKDFPEAPVLPIRQVSSKEKHMFTRHKYWLSKEQWKQFEKQAARRNLTPSAALLTLYSEVLSAWSGQNRFAIMLTVFSRDPVHPQIEKLVGDFTRLVLLDIQRKQEATGKNARRIQQNMQEDLEKNIYSALDFVKEKKKIDPASSSLYPVVFTSALGMEESEEDKDSFAAGMECQASSTPQVWIDSQVFWEEEGVTVSWDALDEIFLPEVIDDMFSMYIKLIEKAMEEEDFWEQEIVDLRPDAQKEKQNRANQTSQEYIPQLLDKKIWENIESQPDAIAVICEDKAYTYQELGQLAKKTAAFLQSKGAEAGETAAVQVQKSFVQIGVILGILKAGLTYIPLTYHQPEERTRKIMEQAQCRFLLTDIRQEISSDVMII